jgi:hypothetical protein
MPQQTLIDAALAEVNRLREVYNVGPPIEAMPKGRPHSADACPIAQCFPTWTLVTQCWMEGEWIPHNEGAAVYGLLPARAISTPMMIADFINEFDNGRVPELIER